MAAALIRQIRKAKKEFISPAGYMYEADGPDWRYYFSTHHSNVHMSWHYGKEKRAGNNRTIGDYIREEYERTTEWLAYNAVLQSYGELFFLNRAIESRTSMAAFGRIETPLSEVVPLARAFSVTEKERQQQLAWSREELAKHWGSPLSLEIGDRYGYSPYAFIHRNHEWWYPDEPDRQATRAELPCHKSDRFVHQHVDDRQQQIFTYIRRPGYYLAFNSGPSHRGQQRKGIGLVWNSEHGIMVQSQTGSDFYAWGARYAKENRFIESDGV